MQYKFSDVFKIKLPVSVYFFNSRDTFATGFCRLNFSLKERQEHKNKTCDKKTCKNNIVIKIIPKNIYLKKLLKLYLIKNRKF